MRYCYPLSNLLFLVFKRNLFNWYMFNQSIRVNLQPVPKPNHKWSKPCGSLRLCTNFRSWQPLCWDGSVNCWRLKTNLNQENYSRVSQTNTPSTLYYRCCEKKSLRSNPTKRIKESDTDCPSHFSNSILNKQTFALFPSRASNSISTTLKCTLNKSQMIIKSSRHQKTHWYCWCFRNPATPGM